MSIATAGQRRRLSNPESHAQFLYEARGDSRTALKSYNNPQGSNETSHGLSRTHNLALLTFLAGNRKTTEQAYLAALKEFHSRKVEDGRNGESDDISLQQLVLSYNLALHAYFTREFETARKIIYPIYEFIVNAEEDMEHLCYGDIKCKIAFLFIDCMLEIFDVKTAGDMLNWIENYIGYRSGTSASDENCNANEALSFQQESDTELKFRLHCYRARYLFMCVEHNGGNLESNLKKARKELKNAMEIYNHKLSGKKGNAESIEDGTGSVQDSVSPSIDSGHGTSTTNDHNRHGDVSFISNGISNGSTISTASCHPDDNQTPFESRMSISQNQHVLCLKAKLEYLKGNCTKSLKLCHEGQNTIDKIGGDVGDDQTANIVHAIYHHNIALVHQASGQFHLAMHHYACSLGHIEQAEKGSDFINNDGVSIHMDGTAQHISVEQVLYNAAICSQECGNYVASCECMLRFIHLSNRCMKHPFPWLHLSESCIGLYKSQKIGDDKWSQQKQHVDSSFLNPLPTAVTYLTRCMALCHELPKQSDFCKRILESARVSLAFVWLELNNPASVVCLADVVLSEELPTEQSELAISQRHRATIRLYACEAMSLMGNPKGGLKYLPDDLNDIFDFVSDASGMTNEMKEANFASVMAMKRMANST